MNLANLQQAFHKKFPLAGTPIVVQAPGRVNLIGEHTDYNDGFVLPMAINASILLAGSLRDDSMVHIYSLDFQETSVFNLNEISLCSKTPWSNYVRGVCAMFLETRAIKGMNMVIQGDIPQGAGLSSSAALEIGTALLVRNLNKLNASDLDLIKLAQRAESEFVGVQCGIMDQFVSMLGKKDHALFLDCRSLDYQLAPVAFSDAKVMVINSGVKRGLVDSEYNLRRQQCNEAVAQLKQHLPGITALRDVGVEHLTLINNLEGDLAKRARHVVTENQRVLDAVQLFKTGNITGFGKLMNESHTSLRDDYQVSCPQLDLLVELAQSVPGVFGSRMTGAGFGGCTVSLVHKSSVAKLTDTILNEYYQKTGIMPKIYLYSPSDGAKQIG